MTLPSGSAIPGALAYFLPAAHSTLAAWQADEVTVWYGGQLPTYNTPLTLQVTEITGDQAPAEIGPRFRREEVFSMVCTLSYFRGGATDDLGQMGLGNVADLQTLMAAFNQVAFLVANNPTLGGAVRFAQVGNFDINPTTDSNGLTAQELDFQIRCEQRVESLG